VECTRAAGWLPPAPRGHPFRGRYVADPAPVARPCQVQEFYSLKIRGGIPVALGYIPLPGYWILTTTLQSAAVLKLPDSHRQRMPIVPAPMQATTEAQSTHRVHGNGESRNDVGCQDHEHTQRE
jgi:hypothetical protein